MKVHIDVSEQYFRFEEISSYVLNVSDTECESLKERSDPKRQHNKNEKVTGKKNRFKALAIAI